LDSEWFLHDPLKVLLRDPPPGLQGPYEIDDEWKVTTCVVNHHRTLSRIHLIATAAVAPAEKTVALTFYKQPGEPER